MSSVKRTVKRRRERWHQTWGLAVAKLLAVRPEVVHVYKHGIPRKGGITMEIVKLMGMHESNKNRKALQHACCLYHQEKLKFFTEAQPDGEATGT